MSMRHVGGYGYVVEVEKLASILPLSLIPKFQELCQAKDPMAIAEFLDENLINIGGSCLCPDIFKLSEEDESDDLEVGKVYACWDVNDLYTLIPSTKLHELRAKGINPLERSWVKFG